MEQLTSKLDHITEKRREKIIQSSLKVYLHFLNRPVIEKLLEQLFWLDSQNNLRFKELLEWINLCQIKLSEYGDWHSLND